MNLKLYKANVRSNQLPQYSFLEHDSELPLHFQ